MRTDRLVENSIYYLLRWNFNLQERGPALQIATVRYICRSRGMYRFSDCHWLPEEAGAAKDVFYVCPVVGEDGAELIEHLFHEGDLVTAITEWTRDDEGVDREAAQPDDEKPEKSK